MGHIASISGGRQQEPGGDHAQSAEGEAGLRGGGQGWVADGWNAEDIRNRMQGPGALK